MSTDKYTAEEPVTKEKPSVRAAKRTEQKGSVEDFIALLRRWNESGEADADPEELRREMNAGRGYEAFKRL